jgi:uncharacterized membrane-anchored protein YhcB (DUF1043 family)
MNGESSLLLWLAVGGLFVAALVIGVIVGRLSNPDYRRMRRLQDELEASRAEMAAYQGKVTEHFAKTARLFNHLNKDYQQVYRHLAAGCHTLCVEDRPQLEEESPLGTGMPVAQPRHEQTGDADAARRADKNRLAGNEGLGIG